MATPGAKPATPIQIEQVANGFIVRPAIALSSGRDPFCMGNVQEFRVFPSLSDFTLFLFTHFESAPGWVAPDKVLSPEALDSLEKWVLARLAERVKVSADSSPSLMVTTPSAIFNKDA